MLQFPPDVTALYQLALFVALWFVLKRIVFDRFLENLADRSRRTDGMVAEAKRFREEAEAMREAHETFLAQARREAADAREEIRREAEREERKLLDDARDEAARVLAGLRERAQAETEAARRTLEQETQALSERIAQSLLGRAS